MSCGRRRGARALATASAFSSPVTRNHTSRARLRAAKVRLIRSGGGLGESVHGDRDPVLHVQRRVPGEQRRHVAVRARRPASRSRTAPAPCSRTRRRTPRRPRDSAAVVRGGHLVHLAGSTPTASRNVRAGLAGVALRVVGGDEPLVAPPDVHPATSRRPSRRRSRRSRGARHRDGAAGERDLRLAGRRPGSRRAGPSSSPATACARASGRCAEGLDLPRLGHVSGLLALIFGAARLPVLAIRFAVAAYTSSSSSRRSSSASSSGEVAALERDRPVRLRRARRTSPACRRRGRSGSAPSLVSSTTSVMPGPSELRAGDLDLEPVRQPGGEQVGAGADPLGGHRRAGAPSAGAGPAPPRAAPATR